MVIVISGGTVNKDVFPDDLFLSPHSSTPFLSEEDTHLKYLLQRFSHAHTDTPLFLIGQKKKFAANFGKNRSSERFYKFASEYSPCKANYRYIVGTL